MFENMFNELKGGLSNRDLYLTMLDDEKMFYEMYDLRIYDQ